MATYNGTYVRRELTGAARTKLSPLVNLRSLDIQGTRVKINKMDTSLKSITIYRADRKVVTKSDVVLRSMGMTADRPNINNISLLFPRITPIDYSWTKNIK